MILDGPRGSEEAGMAVISHGIKHLALAVLGRRTLRAVRFDLLRLRTRLLGRRRNLVPSAPLLHLGCGARRVPGFLNVDVVASEHDVDLGGGKLPWVSASFEAVVAQQVIEHLELESELMPLLREIVRVLAPGGQAWLACPDMERVCRSYLADGGESLLADRVKRWPSFELRTPSQHMVNEVFHQSGEHVNLFDFALLSWVLRQAGFTAVRRVTEQDLLERFPQFPVRSDDEFGLYVCATR